MFGRNYKARISNLEQKGSESGGMNITVSPNIYVQPTQSGEMIPIAEEPDGESDDT